MWRWSRLWRGSSLSLFPMLAPQADAFYSLKSYCSPTRIFLARIYLAIQARLTITRSNSSSNGGFRMVCRLLLPIRGRTRLTPDPPVQSGILSPMLVYRRQQIAALPLLTFGIHFLPG